MIEKMKDLAHNLLQSHGKSGLMGFHAPYFTTIPHLHLHIIEKPFHSFLK
jgi:hypothetical protein